VKSNLTQLTGPLHHNPRLFKFGFKRSLQSYVTEKQKLEAQEVENILEMQRHMMSEQKSDRLKQLRELQAKFNIKLKTSVNEAGEEVVCAEVPFQQKMRNECNDYHYFYTYKKDRCPILQDKTQELIVSGQAEKQLAEFKA